MKCLLNIYKYLYSEIEVRPGIWNPNFLCHVNSVHKALELDEDKVAVTICFNKNNLFLHFINTQGGQFVDNTLGDVSKQFSYLLVRFVYKKDFLTINKIFTSLKRKLIIK
jgi:hypothetical protein